MRSRYTAYAVGQVDYIVATHVAEGRDGVDKNATAEWSKQAEWRGLEIVATEAGGPDDAIGTVEFIARYAISGNELSHHERSRFRKDDGAWFYVDGDMVKPRPKVRDEAKVGRNEPCPCGSGKKFKKCHGA